MITIVSVPSCRNSEDVKPAMLDILNQLKYHPTKPRIFLKPNIVDATKPIEAIVVDPAVVGGLILALYEKGVKEFVIGEGTGYFSTEDKNWLRLLEGSGYEKLAKSLEKKYGIDVPLINLEKAEREDYTWSLGTVPLPKLCRTHSYINIAKMKNHIHTFVTLTLKNQKGLLRVEEKKKFHRGIKGADLHTCIRELGKVMQPELAIIDATRALEGSGPITEGEGQTKVRQLNLCIAGTDMNEVDTLACHVMGINPAEVKHLKETDGQFTAGSVPLEQAKARPPFQRPNPEVRMGIFHRYVLDTACTGCQLELVRMFRKIMFVPELRDELAELIGKNPRVNIIMGKTPPDFTQCITKKGGKMLFWGNCTKKVAEEFCAAHVPGCSPDHNEGVKVLMDLLKKEEK